MLEGWRILEDRSDSSRLNWESLNIVRGILDSEDISILDRALRSPRSVQMREPTSQPDHDS